MRSFDASDVPFVVQLDVDEASGLTGLVISNLMAACDAVEDAAPIGLLALRLRGSTQATPVWPGSSDLESVHKWEKALRRLDRLPGVTLAVVAGQCGAGALDVLSAVDHRIAASSMQIHLRVAGHGSWPSLAMYRVTARSGHSAARRLFMFSAGVDSPQAVRMGLVDVVVEDTERAQQQFVASLAGVDLRALASRRMLLSESQMLGYERAVGLHLAACDAELRRRHVRDSDDTRLNGEHAGNL